MKKFFTIVCAALVLAGCAQKQADSDLTLNFEGRSIDIAPYFKDFPYSLFSVSKNGSKLMFFKTGDHQTLQWTDINKGADLRNAADVVNYDFAKRNCWSPMYNETDSMVYWIGDEQNEEIINIYRTRPGSNNVEKLTDVPYIYAWNFNPEGTKIAYVSRMGQNENRLDELHVIDLKTMSDSLICEDTPDFRYTWGSICWQPEGKGLMLLGLKDMDRTYTNVLYIDLATKNATVLTDSSKEGSLSGCIVLDEWVNPDQAWFISDQDGYNNLYSFTLSTGKVEQVTQYKMNLDNACFVNIDGKKYVFALQSNPIRTNMILIDPETKEVLFEQPSDLSLTLGGVKGNEVTMVAGGTTTLFQVIRASVTLQNAKLEVIMDTPKDLQDKLVHSTVERLEIPTFDIDSVTGKQRILHAYLFKPVNPLPADKSLLMVESFYGGENRYSSEYQILNQAGIYVLSASPRGSAGFGRDFAAMNDHDLGGNETIDMIYVSRYVADKLGIPASRVGVFGMSHGGYETMRLMTFPGEVNGHKASFPFGFGIETAGFCDIIWQHHHSNIPDWTALEAGDPATDSLKLVDRSPITYADKITGPLLLIHGDHDNRVDIGGSQFMADKLEELGKPYKFVKFPGLGHGIKGTQNNYKFYSECFDFIEKQVLDKQQ